MERMKRFRSNPSTDTDSIDTVRVRLVDHLGRTRSAVLDTRTRVADLKATILDELDLSRVDSEGREVEYALIHEGRVLDDTATLQDAGVMTDDKLVLNPTITSA